MATCSNSSIGSMLTTAIIAFREFLEAFLIVGVFMGISRKLSLKKEREIVIAAGLGIVISLILASVTYIFGDYARGLLTERNADLLESYLLIFSGVFIAYVVFSLHNAIRRNRGATLVKAHQQLKKNIFDISLFLTIVFVVVREGFEIALFTATTSLFSEFLQNFLGLLFGFAAASVLGMATYFAYIKFPLGKVFKATEYMIVLLGASLVQNGVTQLFQLHFNISLSNIAPLHMQFLPESESVVGHVVQNLFGLDREFSLVRLAIMLGYIGVVYVLFLRPKATVAVSK